MLEIVAAAATIVGAWTSRDVQANPGYTFALVFRADGTCEAERLHEWRQAGSDYTVLVVWKCRYTTSGDSVNFSDFQYAEVGRGPQDGHSNYIRANAPKDESPPPAVLHYRLDDSDSAHRRLVVIKDGHDGTVFNEGAEINLPL
ncbi:MAG TPA: hypothetical protein VKG44_11395 [Candidatus Baltobacteraceae bacterium]|nr:hypothetical protein [Candidatus Baltobacteraceae bacterium]